MWADILAAREPWFTSPAMSHSDITCPGMTHREAHRHLSGILPAKLQLDQGQIRRPSKFKVPAEELAQASGSQTTQLLENLERHETKRQDLALASGTKGHSGREGQKSKQPPNSNKPHEAWSSAHRAFLSWAWGSKPVIPRVRMLRQELCEFK